MEHRASWESNIFSASQETSRILWNQKFYHRIHISSPPVPNLSQIDPEHVRNPLLEDPF
jgi:hypothetical protein